ncbi:hypothetical protein, partial [Streptomyces sp. WAC01526]|uniref:hypothetical protein n=1 Tax=Streptomyces sp. WAC01526 TaxID=2588709 RepID=UPI001CA37372
MQRIAPLHRVCTARPPPHHFTARSTLHALHVTSHSARRFAVPSSAPEDPMQHEPSAPTPTP